MGSRDIGQQLLTNRLSFILWTGIILDLFHTSG